MARPHIRVGARVWCSLLVATQPTDVADDQTAMCMLRVCRTPHTSISRSFWWIPSTMQCAT